MFKVVWALDWIADNALCAVDMLAETRLLPLVRVCSRPACSFSDSSWPDWPPSCKPRSAYWPVDSSVIALVSDDLACMTGPTRLLAR
jgi:hypothetical protein